MKLFIIFLLSVSNCLPLAGQNISQKDILELAACADFDCFESNVLSKGISLKEDPYKDAFGGKHQIIFNEKYKLADIEVYSVGITFKDELTTLFLRSKNEEYKSGVIDELLAWGEFENTASNSKDGSTTYSSYKSKKYQNYTLRTEAFYDSDDKCNYYVVKLTKPTKNNEQPKYSLKFSSGEGLFTVESNRKRGFIDSSDKVIIPLVYDMATNFKEGLAHVKRNDKWGFIDKTGKEIIPFVYDDAGFFSEGFANVKLNGKSGFIDKTGKEIIPCKYDRVGFFSQGIADVKLNDKWGIVDQKGKEIVVPKYESMEIYEGFPAIVSLNEKYGFIDKTGKEIIPLKYDAVSGFKQGFTAAQLNAKWGVIDQSGKTIIPFKYDYTDFQSSYVDIGPFSDGLLRVAIGEVKFNGEWHGGKWGFVDKTGKEVIPLKYDWTTIFENGKAKVGLNGREFYIDKTGKEVK